MRVDQLSYGPDGRLELEITCTARLKMFGRFSQWRHGVQLVSFSVDAEADVKLIMQCQRWTRWESTDSGPAFVIQPTVHDADLRLERFRLFVSAIYVDLSSSQFSHGIREMLEEQIEAPEARW